MSIISSHIMVSCIYELYDNPKLFHAIVKFVVSVISDEAYSFQHLPNYHISVRLQLDCSSDISPLYIECEPNTSFMHNFIFGNEC